jgi:hypothetical protein
MVTAREHGDSKHGNSETAREHSDSERGGSKKAQ